MPRPNSGLDSARTPLIDSEESGGTDPLSRLAQARRAAPAADTPDVASSSSDGTNNTSTEQSTTSPGAAKDVEAQDLEDERECRICGGGDEDGPLMNPCACTGSMSLIHADCLRKWIETRRQNAAHGHGGTSADPMRCEICHENYQICVRDEFVCDYEHVCTCTSCGHITEGTKPSQKKQAHAHDSRPPY